MKRRAPGERVRRFRRRDAERELADLRENMSAWAEGEVGALAGAEPDLPGELGDRACDAWEPLLAIADRVGADWPARARAAAVALSSDGRAEGESVGVRLLGDIRGVVAGRERITTAELLEGLIGLEESPWGDWRGKPLAARSLAAMLRKYDIASAQVRFEDGRHQGFRAGQFEDCFARYLAPSPPHPPSDPDASDRGGA